MYNKKSSYETMSPEHKSTFATSHVTVPSISCQRMSSLKYLWYVRLQGTVVIALWFVY